MHDPGQTKTGEWNRQVPEPLPQSLTQIHLDRNRVTRGDWSMFAPHRERVTRLLCEASRPNSDHPSLCVLGAGNGNDLDLDVVCETFEKITLVDLDGEALHHLVDAQPAKIRERISIVPGVDLSSILDQFATPGPHRDRLDDLILKAKSPTTPLGLHRFDVVASTCLLTQLIDVALQGVRRWNPQLDHSKTDHPRISELAIAMRDGHLQLLTDLLAPGGRIVLVSDFVSSDTLPELFAVNDAQLGELVSEAINQGNFFTGVNPIVLAHWFRTRPEPPFGNVQLGPPWKWQLGNRTYAVCGITAAR